jgi:alkylresorcinol/alkylpyrone synthase
VVHCRRRDPSWHGFLGRPASGFRAARSSVFLGYSLAGPVDPLFQADIAAPPNLRNMHLAMHSPRPSPAAEFSAPGATRASLLSLATAVPPHVLGQADAALAAERMFAGRMADYQRLAAVFGSTGIVKRHSVRPMSWFFEDRGWPERTAAYLEGAAALFVEAAGAALQQAGLSGADVDAVVTVSSTGVATPSLDARVAAAMGFRPDALRVPVFGLGCAAGVTGLALAARLAAAQPGRRVLFVAVELCTLAFRLDRADKTNIIASALFGDGAAAAVLQAGGPDGGIGEIEAAGEHTWPDTLDVMGWSMDPTGLGVILARAVPRFAEKEVGPAVAAILGRIGVERGSIDRFVCHPGGAKVVAALESSLGLGDGALDLEREVLADYGNMSAPTVLFVLDRAIARGLPPRVLLVAMGPGFTCTCLALRRTP